MGKVFGERCVVKGQMLCEWCAPSALRQADVTDSRLRPAHHTLTLIITSPLLTFLYSHGHCFIESHHIDCISRAIKYHHV
jgi:hypothetical protein